MHQELLNSILKLMLDLLHLTIKTINGIVLVTELRVQLNTY